MTSANFFSVFLKYITPVMKISAVMARDTAKAGTLIFITSPITAHLKPSMTPTIGLSEYKNINFSGTISLLKPTGEIYNPN